MLLELLLLDAVALVGGTVHPMTPGAEAAAVTVLIEGDRIVALGADVQVPEGARVVDASGLHVIPGLVDGLAYFDPAHDDLYTAAGVTLVREHGNDLARVLSLRERELRDRVAGPWLSVSGAVLDGTPPSSANALVLEDEHQAHAYVPALIAENVDFLAVQVNLGAEAWREVLSLAHPAEGRRLQVWGPVPRAVDLDQALEAGQDGLLFLDALLPAGATWENVELEDFASVIERLAAAGVRVTPLLRGTARQVDADGAESPRLRLLGPQYEGLWLQDLEIRDGLGESHRELAREVLAKQRALVARLDAAGVALVPGSGAPHPWLMPGAGLADELAEWSAAGLSPARCLELATVGAARALELEGRGVVEAGALADLVLLRADPREDVGALREVETVVLRGRVLERAELEGRVAALREALEAERRAAEGPLAIAPPQLPDGSVLLEGYAETSGPGGRIAGERWAVVRADNGDLHFCGRRLVPGGSKDQEIEVAVIQTVRRGALESFQVELRTGGHELAVRGQVVAGQMRVERRLDGGFVDTQAARETLAAVDASSVTTLMLIAQTRAAGPMPVLRFDEGLELEVVRWDLALEDDGDHWLRTPGGRHFAAFRPDGALKAAATWQGSGVVQIESRSIDARGGPGLPLPEDKLARVRAAEAAAAAGGEPPDEPPPDEPPPPEPGGGG